MGRSRVGAASKLARVRVGEGKCLEAGTSWRVMQMRNLDNIINKVYVSFVIDENQEVQNNCMKIEKNTGKVLAVPKIVVPLHPLNEKRMFRVRQEERVLWKIYIDRSSTRSKSSNALGYKKRTVKFMRSRKQPHLNLGAYNLIQDSRSETDYR